MPNFANSLRECLGFSHIMISTFFNVSLARILISSKFPIGVATMYKPGSILIFSYLIIFLSSCAPVIYPESEKEVTVPAKQEKNIKILKETSIEKKEKNETLTFYENNPLKNEISIILPKGKKNKITNQFIDVIEMAVYEKELEDISFSIHLFDSLINLEEFIESSTSPGKIFIGPTDSLETKLLNKYCKSGAIFFSFSSDKKLAKDCVFLVNFFPENELEVLFKNFKPGSKIALLYPENSLSSYPPSYRLYSILL